MIRPLWEDIATMFIFDLNLGEFAKFHFSIESADIFVAVFIFIAYKFVACLLKLLVTN